MTSPCGSCNPCVTPPSEEPHSAYSYDSLYDQPTALQLGSRVPKLSSPFESPPTSLRSPSRTHNPYFPSYASSDSSFGGRRPSTTLDSDPDVCDNCQMTVPMKYCQKLPRGAPGSPSKDGRRGVNGSPVLRTSKNFPVRRRHARDDASSTDSSDLSDTEQSRSYESAESIPPSPMFASRDMHTHTLNYTTTNTPQHPATFSVLKRACIRTLSAEVLPLGKSSGPLFFGDAVAGYTIAYIFRLQDPRSRGAKRTYALVAMVGRDMRRATRALVQVTETFQAIAHRIVSLAEQVLERESAAYQTLSRPTTAVPTTPPYGTSASSMPPLLTSPRADRFFSSTASSPTRNITPASSFLSAKRVDPDGFPRVSRDVMKAKSLTEIVGQENFFVELHGIFASLLHSLVKQYG